MEGCRQHFFFFGGGGKGRRKKNPASQKLGNDGLDGHHENLCAAGTTTIISQFKNEGKKEWALFQCTQLESLLRNSTKTFLLRPPTNQRPTMGNKLRPNVWAFPYHTIFGARIAFAHLRRRRRRRRKQHLLLLPIFFSLSTFRNPSLLGRFLFFLFFHHQRIQYLAACGVLRGGKGCPEHCPQRGRGERKRGVSGHLLR